MAKANRQYNPIINNRQQILEKHREELFNWRVRNISSGMRNREISFLHIR